MPFDSTEIENISDAIRKARRLIIERGWCQGIAEDTTGRFCLFGAIREATHGQDGNPLYRAVCGRVGSLVGGSDMYITSWNDFRGRTEDEVLALLDRAVEIM